MNPRQVVPVLDVQIDALTRESALSRILRWGQSRESRYVAICNAHVVVTAWKDLAFRRTINGADMATPDGAPVAWMLRRLGVSGQARITGPDLMWGLVQRCAVEGIAVYLYGSTDTTLSALLLRLHSAFPGLVIAGAESPPFRELSEVEDVATVERINASDAGVVFVGLGCPKQERWMAAHRERVRAVMIGVGAAFDFHGGTLKRAPRWMRDHGLEWLHRVLSEPSRLWKRYLVTNTFFVLGATVQLARAGFAEFLVKCMRRPW